MGRGLLAVLVILGVVLGVFFGLVFLGGEVEAPKPHYPVVELEYLYIKIYNVSSGVRSLANTTMLSYVAIVNVVNTDEETIAAKSIEIAIPSQVLIQEPTSETSAFNFTVTVARVGGLRLEEEPINGSFIVIYDSSETKHVPAHGSVNNLLRGYGTTYYPTYDTSYFISGKSSKRFIVSGTAPIPTLWSSRLDYWLANGTYVMVSFEGKEANGKGYAEALLVLRVKLNSVGENEYYFGSLPEKYRLSEISDTVN